jgi:hypothetical protein
MSEKSKTFEIIERSTEHTQRVVFEDFDGDEFMCSMCNEDDHDESGRAPTRASEILCDSHDHEGRAPKRAPNILRIDKLNPSIHPTIKATQGRTRKGERPKDSIGNSSPVAIAANSGNSASASVSVATADAIDSNGALTTTTTEMADTPAVWYNGDIKHQSEYERRPKLETEVDSGEWTAVIAAMEMAETLAAMEMPPLMETADDPSESDEWDSEEELSDLDPWLSDSESDYEPVDDPQYAEVMADWDLWRGPCMCGSKQPGRGCTSARCVNGDEEEAPPAIAYNDDDYDSDSDESHSEPCYPPFGSSEDSPPATDDGRLADEKTTEECAKTCLSRNPVSSKRKKRHWTKIESHHTVAVGPNAFTAGVIQPRSTREEPERPVLCPLGGIARRPAQLAPVMSKEVTWEKLTLTVDSGASDTVVPPKFCSWSTIFHTEKVGTEYEVANGQVVHNLGERRCIMKVSEKIAELNIAFQVVEVHKPLLAVSSITAQGHQVVFKDGDDHIALANGEKLPLRNVNGVFELDVWIKRDPGAPGFARQGPQ